jgi:SAM-dependent methyltransferase
MKFLSIWQRWIRRVLRGRVVSRSLSLVNLEVQASDELTNLANWYGCDKGTVCKEGHGYTKHYSRYFAPLRDEAITLLEMGLLMTDEDRRRAENSAEGTSMVAAPRAPSLSMWLGYFPRAFVVGFDIYDFSGLRLDRTRIIQGDMSNREDLARAVAAGNGPFDIIIDDASHVAQHQQIAFGYLFRFLRPNGLYVIEDLHYPSPLDRPDAVRTVDLLRRFQLDRRFESKFITPAEQEYIEAESESIVLHDSTGYPDGVAVIRKRKVP